MMSKTITPMGARYAGAGPRLWPTAGNGTAGAAGSAFAGAGIAVLAHDRAATGTKIVRTVPMSARVDFRSTKPARPPRGVPR